MKARTLFLALAAVFSASAYAQAGNATKPIPMPATAPVAAPAPAHLVPPPPVATAVTPAPVSNTARNPLKPPVAAPAPAPVAAPVAPTLPPPGMPGMGKTTLPGMPADAMSPDTDPVKANGKRIGSLNGKAIFKHEEAYYFDTETEKTKK